MQLKKETESDGPESWQENKERSSSLNLRGKDSSEDQK